MVGGADVQGRGAQVTFLDGRTMVIVKDPDGVDLVTYPIGDGLINWVVMMPESDPGPLPGDAKWNQPGDRSAIVAALGALELGFLDAADLVRRTEAGARVPDGRPGRAAVVGTRPGDAARRCRPSDVSRWRQRWFAGDRRRAGAGRRAGRATSTTGCGPTRTIRRPETADVVAANREMHVTGATQRPEDLARVTGKYREDTEADKVQPMTTYVLIPGACHGAWCFDDLAAALRSRGHRVLAITLTGVAERAHLLHAGVNLETHVADVLAELAVHDVSDAVLVGHSYGGMVITAVADRVPQQVDALVYLDALVPNGRRIMLGLGQ